MNARLREEEIRPDDLMDEQRRRFARDVAWLVARRKDFVSVPCPACRSRRHRPEWRKFDLDFVRCMDCATVLMEPRPSTALLADFYQRSENYEYWNRVVFPASEEARREKIFRPRAERVAEIAARHSGALRGIVDVGAGFGTFCEEVRDIGCFERVVALEPEPHLAETCHRKGLEVISTPVEDAQFPENEITVVTSFEVIEHLFSPREFVRQCASLIPTGGLFVITCPNVEGFEISVLGSASSTVDPEHLNYMHPTSLGQLLEAEGFRVLEASTPGRLDAELVRKRALSGEYDLSDQPFLSRVLIDDWEMLGDRFQDFLIGSGMSSNMWLVAQRE